MNMKTLKLAGLAFIALALCTVSCKKDDPKPGESGSSLLTGGRSNKYWPIHEANKGGYIDKDGNVKTLEFEFAQHFSYDMAAVSKTREITEKTEYNDVVSTFWDYNNSKETEYYGYYRNNDNIKHYNKNGDNLNDSDLYDNYYILVPYYTEETSTTEVYGYINHNLEPVIDYKYREAYEFSKNGLALTYSNGKVQYIDKQGVNIGDTYSYASEFYDNLAFVRESNENSYKCIEYKGNTFNVKFTLNSDFRYPNSFYGGLSLVQTEDYKIGFINKEGAIAIPAIYEEAGFFNDGLTYFTKNGSDYGFMDSEGNVIIEPSYSDAWQFINELAPVKQGNKWIFINKEGNQAVDGRYEYAMWFNEGLAPVLEDGYWGFINTKGEYSINPQFKYAYPFINGLAEVEFSNGWGYINKEGKTVWKTESSLYFNLKSAKDIKAKGMATLKRLLAK